MTKKKILPLMLFSTVAFLIIMVACSPVENISGSEVTNENVIALTGKVLDRNNIGVPNIEAKLAGLGFSDTTDDNGNYTITVSEDSIEALGIILDGFIDTLVINSNEEEITSYSISDFIDTLPNTYLVQRNVWGKLLGTASAGSRVVATIVAGEESVKRELWLNTGTSEFSGFVYMRPLNSNVNYSVYVNIYDSEGRLTGRSEVVTFPDQAGDIHIPDFHPTAGVPIVSFDTVYVKTDVWFNARDSHGLFTKEWIFSHNDSVVGTKTGGSVPFQFLNSGLHTVTLTVSDGVDNPQVYSKEIVTINRPSTIVGLEYGRDTVTINDTTLFSLTASDPEGVKEILWDFGEGDSIRPRFDSTMGSVSEVSHIWPSSTVVPLGEQVDFEITASIIDSLDDTTVHTFPMTVSNKAPVILSQSVPVFGISGDTIQFEIEAEDDNRIVQYKFSHGGTTYTSQTSVIEFVVPDTTDADYQVTVTAIDEDMNNSSSVIMSAGINIWTHTDIPRNIIDVVVLLDSTIVLRSEKQLWFEGQYSGTKYYSLAKTNNGVTLWMKELDGSGPYDNSGYSSNIAVTSTNSFALAFGLSYRGIDYTVYGSTGAVENEMSFYLSTNSNGIESLDIFNSSIGNILITYVTTEWDSLYYPVKTRRLFKYTSDGAFIWSVSASADYCYEMEDSTTVVFSRSGKMIFVDNGGHKSDAINLGVSDLVFAKELDNDDFIVVHKLNDEYYVRRINLSGDMIWEIPAVMSGSIKDITESPNGDIAYVQDVNSTITLTILDQNGNLKTTQQLSREGDGTVTAIARTMDSCYVVGGSLGGKGALIKTDQSGKASLVY